MENNKNNHHQQKMFSFGPNRLIDREDVHEIDQTDGFFLKNESTYGLLNPESFLVGGLEHFLFSHLLGIVIPIDFQIFQRGGPTTSQILFFLFCHLV